jgi:two-component system CheB/CheR fusion protein
MALHNFKNLTEFTQFLMENPEALKAVSQDILIQVTKFFREPELFDLLKEKVFPSLITKQRGNDPIRIWVPGCCSGEEVYSILICLIEFLEEGGHRNAIQIFGTDLSESAVQKAREATYIENITLDVSEARLARFFTKVGTHYELHKSLRDMCIFAKHNVVKDPPFGKLDLISCRNLLIYLETPLQNRVLSLFHYALKAKGILVLGNAETVAGVSELYSVIDSRNRIYEKKQQVHRLSYDFLGTQLTANRIAISSAPTLHLESASRGIQMQRDADRFLMGEYCPPSVLIDENLEIVQFRGQTGPYFEHSPGFASFSLLGMLKEGLGGEVRKALEVAQTKKTSCRKEGLTLLSQGQSLKVAIEVFPMALPTTGECYYILIFENMDSPSFKTSAIRRKIKSAGKVRENEAQELTFLRAELASTKEYLQSINEEKEATNEELKAANEEIMSSNEELQSTNEELNSAKEELQSTNEELMTVNDELKLRNQDLSLLNDDLSNLFNSLNSAVVLLNKDLKVRRFTPLAKDLLRLLPGDVGRSILDIRPNVEIKDLQKLLFLVIATGIPKELEIQEPQGIWYSVQLKSYRTSQNKIDGAVILFTDVTKIKTA